MRYQIGEQLGVGASGRIFRAFDPVTNRFVALKQISLSRVRQLEIQAAAKLVHPHIVPIYDVVVENDSLYIASELCRGNLESEHLPHNSGQAVDLGRQLAAALSYAHSHGILHRDLKPSNVLVAKDGSFKLSDFGVGGELEHSTQQTRAFEIAGTPLFMSPEQAAGQPQGPSSDIFGLALLLFKIIYGEVPNQQEPLYAVLRARVTSRIQVPARPDVPDELRELLQRSLALNPIERPQSAEEFLKDLSRIDISRQVSPIPELPRPAPPVSRSTEITVQAEPVPSRQPPKKWWIVGASVAIVLLVLIAVWYIPRDVQSSPGSDSQVTSFIWRAVLGLILILGGFGVARLFRARATYLPETQERAAKIVYGASTREDLTKSLMVQVDDVISRLKSLDARVIGLSVVAMVHEVEKGTTSSDRQAALMNVVSLMEKLQNHLSPWHVRHKEAIATTISVLGCLTGIASVVSGFIR